MPYQKYKQIFGSIIVFYLVSSTFILIYYAFKGNIIENKTIARVEVNSSQEVLEEMGVNASYDNFPVFELNGIDPKEIISYVPENDNSSDVLGKMYNSDLSFIPVVVNLPLKHDDYYFRKWQNAKAGTLELNRMPTLKVGDRIGIIKDRYITFNRKYGYEKSNNYFYGSGVCWTVSALGQLMDETNRKFKAKYGLPLFTFNYYDRAPHGHSYTTYSSSNRGHGYTIAATSSPSTTQDYAFNINPALANVEELKDLKIDIVMTASDTYAGAYKGQSIGGYVQTNIDF